MKVLAAGDIHTKTWIIEKVKQMSDKYDRIVFIGDYADDWSASPYDAIETWRKVKECEEAYPNKVKVLMGNHDYIYVNHTESSQSGYNRFTQILIDMPENYDLREWVRNLRVTIDIDGVTYSHAGLIDSYEDGDELWSNNSPLFVRPDNTNYKEIPQVFGHTPSRTCWQVRKNIWCIDTFSTDSQGQLIGDCSMLEIIDGKEFNVISLDKGDNR